MDKSTGSAEQELLIKLASLPSNKRVQLLLEESDQVLWTMFVHGIREGLIVLFQKHHREIVVKVYQKNRHLSEVRLADVQDAFSDFVERILAGKFAEITLRKDFSSFAVHHISFLLLDLHKTKVRRQTLRQEKALILERKDNAQAKIEDEFDLNEVINLIPKIGNKVYRMVLYLIFIQGYNSRDLSGVFGKASLAYDKRSRAMKAFRDLLERNGLLEELR